MDLICRRFSQKSLLRRATERRQSTSLLVYCQGTKYQLKNDSPSNDPRMRLDSLVVMPNHAHAIIEIGGPVGPVVAGLKTRPPGLSHTPAHGGVQKPPP